MLEVKNLSFINLDNFLLGYPFEAIILTYMPLCTSKKQLRKTM
jgi:hypothetical protein